MDLRQYLKVTNQGQVEFAKKVGIAHKTLMNILNGNDIKLSIAARIEIATLGVVKCIELSELNNNQSYAKKQKQQQQNQASLNASIGTTDVN